MQYLELVYDDLPLSVNRIHEVKWFHVAGKRRAEIGYTKEAQNWMRRFQDRVGREFMRDITRFVKQDRPTDLYEVIVVLHISPERFLNKTWLKTGTSKAKAPYKPNDAPNYGKVLYDAVSSTLGRIDDTRFADTDTVKLVSSREMVEVTIIRRDPRDFGVPPEYLLETS